MSVSQRLVQTAQHLIRWNLAGSATYEATRIVHNICLFVAVPTATYGHIGSVFSLVYLAATLGEFGGGSAFVPYLSVITSNRRWFYRTVLLPQLGFLACASLVTHALATARFTSTPFLLIAGLLTITEGIRMTLRTLLHALGQSKVVMGVELCVTATYFLVVWGGYLSGFFALNLASALIPFLVTSAASVCFFIGLIEGALQSKHGEGGVVSLRELMLSRLTLALLHLPQTMLSSNFLVPFFTLHSGLIFGGIAKMASEIAHAIKAIIRATIGFSGTSLFRSYKRAPQEAFSILWQQLNELLGISAIIALCMGPYVCCTMDNGLTFMLLSAFIGLTVADYVFVIYEQLFLVTKRSWVLMMYRLAECCGGVVVVSLFYTKALVVLLVLGCMRICSLAATIWYAHKAWHVRPHAKIESRKIIGALVVGVALMGGLRFLPPFLSKPVVTKLQRKYLS